MPSEREGAPDAGQAPRQAPISTIRACGLPASALLGIYQRQGAYTDCYVIDIARAVTHAEYVEAFYTTAVFRLERWILARAVNRPSTDAQARELAQGERTVFAAWDVEAREPEQLLLRDLHGRTRSWLMTEASSDGGSTRLYFGSAVVPVLNRRTGKAKMGFAFSALLGFHKLYSRVLLRAAVRRLRA